MNTYELIKDVIEAKNFKKDEMIAKIKSCWIKSDITEEEHNELLALIPHNLNAEAERPEVLEIVSALSEKITKLEGRVATLEGTVAETPEYEKWKVWDGISNDYQYGAIVEHNGIVYESICPTQNTWEPGTEGTETVWRVYIG